MHPTISGLLSWWLPALAAAIGFSASTPGADPTKVVPPNRCLVNLYDRNIPLDFCVEPGKEKHLLWKANLGGFVCRGLCGSPVIAGGKVFVGTNNKDPRAPAIQGDHGVMLCLDARTGRLLWQLAHPRLPNQSQDFPQSAIASTPWVEGDRLYYVSNRSELVCATVDGDPKKPGQGKVIWSLDMIAELNVFPCETPFSSPLVVGDLVYVVTGNGRDVADGSLPSPDAPSFIAVDCKTGKLAWKDASPGRNIVQGSWGSPAFANPGGRRPQVIFPGGDGWLHAFEPRTGKPLWQFDCNPKDAIVKKGRRTERVGFLAMPTIWEDRCYIAVGAHPEEGPGVGHLWCIDLTKSGDVSPRDDRFDPKAPANRDSALVWHLGGKVNLPKPKESDYHFGRSMSACTIHDGFLYAAELDGYLHCLDARTGKEHWKVDLEANTWGSPYWVDGKVLLGTDDGDLRVFAHGKKMKKLATIDVDNPVKAAVKVTDGILYLVTDRYLYAIGRKQP